MSTIKSPAATCTNNKLSLTASQHMRQALHLNYTRASQWYDK